jgi:hypothetical protein
MRVLDKYHTTPTLRRHGLLRLNADGIMMTRSLAENYPYSKLYKAAMRGGRDEWLEIVDLAESGELDALTALKHIVALLMNRSARLKALADEALEAVEGVINGIASLDQACEFLLSYVAASSYSARVFEVAMHALLQVLDEEKALDGVLKPLGQMRSANKKHGNIGDIEVIERPESALVLEAYDAKFGKPYLRDELEELSDKLNDHPETRVAGFVVDSTPNLKPEITERLAELEAFHEVKIWLTNFLDWAVAMTEDLPREEIAPRWIRAFAESLCQRRREVAPIDEPVHEWLRELRDFARSRSGPI